MQTKQQQVKYIFERGSHTAYQLLSIQIAIIRNSNNNNNEIALRHAKQKLSATRSIQLRQATK